MSVGSLFEAVLQYPDYMCGKGECEENIHIVSTCSVATEESYSDEEASISSEPPKEDGFYFFDWLIGAEDTGRPDGNSLDAALSSYMKVTSPDPSLRTPKEDGFFVTLFDGLVGARGNEENEPNFLDNLFGSTVNSLGENVYRKTSFVNSREENSYVTLIEQKTLKGLKRFFSC